MDDVSWHAAVRTPAEILAHPRFSEARLLHCRMCFDLFRDFTFSWPQMSVARNVLFATAICQYAGYDPARRETWPTLGRLYDTVAGFQIGSRRMADDFVARLKQIGYLEELPAPGDRRAKILRPTEKMLLHDRRYSAGMFAPLMLLYPDEEYRLGAEMDPEFHIAQRKAGLSLMSRAGVVLGGHPELTRLLAKEAGFGVIIWLIDRAAAGGSHRLEVSLSEIAGLFSVSRTHVRGILRDLEKQGFISLSAMKTRQHAELHPRLLERFDAFMADVFSAQDGLAKFVRWQRASGAAG